MDGASKFVKGDAIAGILIIIINLIGGIAMGMVTTGGLAIGDALRSTASSPSATVSSPRSRRC